jgi:hypothetical protein
MTQANVPVPRPRDETYGQRAWRMSKENPWVPLGVSLHVSSQSLTELLL